MVFSARKIRLSVQCDIAKYGVLSGREVYVHKNEVKETEEHRDCKDVIENLKKQVVLLENKLREEIEKREELEKRVITLKENGD